MRVVGEFPGCGDLRPEWWRLWSHQLVHAGYSHLVNNMVMQVVFGLPINMVHGNLRFAAMYELGVVGGGLSFVLLENLEVTWFERTVLLPAVWVFACGLTVWAVANYSLNFPPWSVYGVDEDSCCVQLIECEQANYLDASDYASFACSGGTSVTKANGRTVLEQNCTVFAQYALTQLGR
jgi:hypothetical protein